MDFDLKKWAPWNWFKKEQDADQGAGNVPVAKTNLSTNPPSPSLDPLLQLHREVDRLFDDAFRGFGGRWPRLTLPTVASEWRGLLRPALDIQESDKQYRITLEVPGVVGRLVVVGRVRGGGLVPQPAGLHPGRRQGPQHRAPRRLHPAQPACAPARRCG